MNHTRESRMGSGGQHKPRKHRANNTLPTPPRQGLEPTTTPSKMPTASIDLNVKTKRSLVTMNLLQEFKVSPSLGSFSLVPSIEEARQSWSFLRCVGEVQVKAHKMGLSGVCHIHQEYQDHIPHGPPRQVSFYPIPSLHNHNLIPAFKAREVGLLVKHCCVGQVQVSEDLSPYSDNSSPSKLNPLSKKSFVKFMY